MPRIRSSIHRLLPALLFLLLYGALAGAPARAQYFGRNKVQWERFDVHVLRTEGFDVYYYPKENRAARDAARMAERWRRRLDPIFGIRFEGRKPIILYADQADFQQTTVAGGLIGEGTGGFTEPIKSRLVMPLTGIYAETDHVMGHEMVHEFQFEAAHGLPRSTTGGAGLAGMPLWMIEGLAEHLSIGRRHPHTAMWVRDALLHDRLPRFHELTEEPRYFPYRWGHAFWAFVDGRYGPEAVPRLFHSALRVGVPAAFRRVLGDDPETVFAAWRGTIRRDYGPVLAARAPLADQGRRVLGKADDKNADLNLAPALSPDGSRIAFLTTRDLFTIDLYLADARTGKVEGKVASSESNPHFEALRFIDSSGSWSPDGRRLAFAVYAEGDTRIAIADVKSRDVERRVDLPGIDSITSPAWSPDGRRIAFSGTVEGQTDLYVVDLPRGRVERLKNDLYADLQPAWSPDGRTLAFVTDEGPRTDLEALTYGPVRLALLDLESGETRLLSILDDARHINPQFSPDGGSLYFIADLDGVSDVYRFAFDDGTLWRVTEVPTGVTGITPLAPALSVAAESGDLAFTVFLDTRYTVHALTRSEARGTPVARGAFAAEAPARAALLPPVRAGERSIVEPPAGSGEPAPPLRAALDRYRPSLSLDFVGPPTIGIGADRYGFGLAGGVSAYFSDILGEHQLGVAFQGGTSSDDDFGGQYGGQALYLNRQRRLNWGGSLSRIPYLSVATFAGPVLDPGGAPTGDIAFQQVVQEVVVNQAGALAFYPFDISHRAEVTATLTRLDVEEHLDALIVRGDTVVGREETRLGGFTLDLREASLAYVGDTSYFGFTSPLRGVRYRFEGGTSVGTLDYRTALADWRGYLFKRPVSLAFRAMHFGRYGGDAEDPRLSPLYLGRETLVRGYGIGSFGLDECTSVANDPTACPEFDRLEGSRLAVVNFELRLPLVGDARLGFADAPYLPVELAPFIDAGVAWTADDRPKLRFARESAERVPVVSAGLAARILLGGILPLQFYYAYPLQRPEEDAVFGFLIAPGW